MVPRGFIQMTRCHHVWHVQLNPNLPRVWHSRGNLFLWIKCLDSFANTERFYKLFMNSVYVNTPPLSRIQGNCYKSCASHTKWSNHHTSMWRQLVTEMLMLLVRKNECMNLNEFNKNPNVLCCAPRLTKNWCYTTKSSKSSGQPFWHMINRNTTALCILPAKKSHDPTVVAALSIMQ